MKWLFSIYFLTFIALFSSANNSLDVKKEKIATLVTQIEGNVSDSAVIQLLFEIANEYYLSNPDTAFYYCEEAQKIALKINDTIGLVDSYNWLGYLYWQKSELQEALTTFNKGLAILPSKEMKNRGDLLNNIGYVYKDLGDIEKGLIFLQKGLTVRENTKDSSGISNSLNNIGLIQKEIGDYDKALTYFEKSYAIRMKINEQNEVANTLNNIATIYGARGENKIARTYYFKGVEIAQKRDDFTPLAMLLNNIGYSYQKDGINDSAWVYYQKSWSVSKKGKSKYWEASVLMRMGELLFIQKKWDAAKKHITEAYQIAKSIGNLERIRDASEQLYILYQQKKNWEKALKYHQEFVSISDSLMNKEKKEHIFKQELNYKYEQKSLADSLLNETSKKMLEAEIIAQKAIAAKEKGEKEQNLLWAATGGVVFSLAVFFLLRINTIRKKANVVLSEKNEEIAQTSQELSKALDERNLLLKEIHHRVKNNLQTVSSLLSLQSRYLNDPTATKALEESQNRLLSISLLHQKLYQNNNQPVVVFKTYLEELTSQIATTCNPIDKSIKIHLNCTDLECDIDLAMPLGLMVNELMTNAYKYAFATQKEGEIRVSLRVLSKDSYQLEVSDNGIGLPANFSIKNSNSMGLNLVKLLTRQLKGTVELIQNKGTTILINFEKKNKYR